MKSASLVSSSFGHFKHLLSTQWKVYGWYILCRVLELLLLGGVVVLLVSGAVFDGGGAGVGALMGFFLAFLAVVAFLLENWFVFCLYRSLDEESKDSSFGAFLNRGKKLYWPTLGKYILFTILLLVGILVFSGAPTLLDGTGVEGFVALIAVAFMLYLGLPTMLTMYEVVIHTRWPLATFLEMRKNLKGMWWRTFGTFLVWVLLTAVVFGGVALLIGFVFFSGFAGLMATLGTSSNPNPLELVESFSGVLSAGLLGSLSVSVLLMILASVVPVYGFFSVYKSVKKSM